MLNTLLLFKSFLSESYLNDCTILGWLNVDEDRKDEVKKVVELFRECKVSKMR